jgi:tetratricopeptide (TPR) repeat protein
VRACISRFSSTLILGLIVLGCVPAASAAAETGAPSPAECAQARSGGPILFEGRTLLETPDITESELRRANALLSAHCFEKAIDILEDFSRRNPDDYHVLFLRARLKWIFNNRPFAQTLIEAALRNHPEFSSAKILLASMYIDDHDFPAAARLLDDVERSHPDDLWAYIDRLRIEAAVAPEQSTADTVVAIMHDSQFPPNARAQALHIVQFELSGLTPSQRDRALASVAEDRSVMTECALSQEAQALIELSNDPRAGEQLIQRYVGKSRPCEHADPNSKCVRSGADTVLQTILLTATPTGKYVTQRQEIVRELLSRGAHVEGMAKLCQPGDGDCATVLLPILKEFEARRAASRTSL